MAGTSPAMTWNEIEPGQPYSKAGSLLNRVLSR